MHSLLCDGAHLLTPEKAIQYALACAAGVEPDAMFAHDAFSVETHAIDSVVADETPYPADGDIASGLVIDALSIGGEHASAVLYDVPSPATADFDSVTGSGGVRTVRAMYADTLIGE